MNTVYELTLTAEADMRDIIRYTIRTHGVSQMHIYTEKLKQCATALASGKEHFRTLPEIHQNLRLLHCQHHYIFGLSRHDKPMLIIAILHESMDILQRLKTRL